MLCGAADEVLATLKDEHLKEREKKEEISSLLGAMEEDQFAMLSGLGRRITDYGTDKQTAGESESKILSNEMFLFIFENKVETFSKADCTCKYTVAL